MAKIILLEPQKFIFDRIYKILTHAEHEVADYIHAADVTGDDIAAVQLLIIDTRYAYHTGMKILYECEKHNLPVLFLSDSTQNTEHMKMMYSYECDVLNYTAGADEISAAIENMLKSGRHMLTAGSLQLDPIKCSAAVNGNRISLTRQEFALLKALIASPGKIISRKQLMRDAWGYEFIGATRTLDVHIQRLRRKIGAQSIATVYRAGYALMMEEKIVRPSGSAGDYRLKTI